MDPRGRSEGGALAYLQTLPVNNWRSPLSSSPNWISAIAVWPIEASPTPKPTIPCGQQAADTTKRQLGSRVSGNNWVVTAIEEQLSDRSATGSVKAEPPFPPSYLLTERCVEHAVAAETILRPNSRVRSIQYNLGLFHPLPLPLLNLSPAPPCRYHPIHHSWAWQALILHLPLRFPTCSPTVQRKTPPNPTSSPKTQDLAIMCTPSSQSMKGIRSKRRVACDGQACSGISQRRGSVTRTGLSPVCCIVSGTILATVLLTYNTHFGSVSIATVRASLTALHRFNFLLCCGCPDGGAELLLPPSADLLGPVAKSTAFSFSAARDVCPWCGGAWLLL